MVCLAYGFFLFFFHVTFLFFLDKIKRVLNQIAVPHNILL